MMDMVVGAAIFFFFLGFFMGSGWMFSRGEKTDHTQDWIDAINRNNTLAEDNSRLTETLDLYDNQIWRLLRLAENRPDKKEQLESET